MRPWNVWPIRSRKIGALQERVDVAISLVRPLLELRGALAERGQRVAVVLHSATARRFDQRLQRAVDDEVRIAPNRRREVRVLSQRQPEVADVRLLVHRLRHRAHDQRLDERPLGRVTKTFRDRLQIARRNGLGNLRFDPQRSQRRQQLVEFLLVRFAVNAVERRRVGFLELVSHGDVRHDHALFDEPVSIVSGSQLDRADTLGGVDYELRFRSVEVQRATLCTCLVESTVNVHEHRELLEERTELCREPQACL